MERYTLEKLEKSFCKELDLLADKIPQNGELSSSIIETAHKLTDTLKNIYKIYVLKEEMESGYSGRHYSQAGMWDANIHGRYGHGMGYDEGGNSYGGEYSGRHYVRGHYSRDGMGGGNYSHDDAKGVMMGELDRMMGMATSDKMREAIERCRESVRNS